MTEMEMCWKAGQQTVSKAKLSGSRDLDMDYTENSSDVSEKSHCLLLITVLLRERHPCVISGINTEASKVADTHLFLVLSPNT